MSKNPQTTNHPFTFARAGGFDQVVLETGADIMAVPELDQKLWLALAMPTRGLEFDERTLDLIDSDDDGRIRAPEMIAAIRWMGKVLADPDQLTQRSDSLPLKAIDQKSDEGARVYASALQILRNLDKADATSISTSDVADTAAIFATTRLNGDGIVPASSATDPAIAEAIEQIVASVGSETDRSGEPGVDKAKVAQFFDAATAYLAWLDEMNADAMPLGDDSEAAVQAFSAVKAKVDDYFTRCRLAAFDPRAGEHMSRAAGEWAEIASRTLTSSDDAIAEFPLATIEPGKALPLGTGLNPAWSGKIADLVQKTVTPLLGERTELTEEEWKDLSGRLSAYEGWMASKAGTEVESLGADRLREMLSGDLRANIESLIDADEALRAEAEGIEAVEKTVRFNRDLLDLLDNFVSFRTFYGKKAPAVFQAGTLFLDGRSCNLVMTVNDPGKHGKLAGLSYAYLAYCDCVRRKTGEKKKIVAAFTDGDTDFLMVGRNGVFYDRDGNDWDATISKVVDNPLSIRQAFWAPYKSFAKMVSAQIEKFASSREKAVTAQTSGAVKGGTAKVGSAAGGKAPAPNPAFDVGKFAGIFAAVGLALGFIGSAVVALVSGFVSLELWQMPIAIAGAMLLISGPSMLMAYMKLRQRNLAPLLDASGWAINARARLNVPFGKSLTDVAVLPTNASRRLDDPYAEKTNPLLRYALPVAIVLVIAGTTLWKTGIAKGWLGL